MTANHDGSELTIRVFFKDTIAPCLQDPNQGEDSCRTVAAGQSADAVAGFVDLDLDRNPGTGRFAFSDRNGPSYSGLGVEAYLDFFRYDPDLGVWRFFDCRTEILRWRIEFRWTFRSVP